MTVEQQLIDEQLNHPKFGVLYQRLYEMTQRTIDEFFSDVTMPTVVLSLETDRSDRQGWYDAEDGLGLKNRINLNPNAIRDGNHAAEVIAHELLHVWAHVVGRPTVGNEHTDEFHERMFSLFGIRTEGTNGRHTANDERWEEWLDQNRDLQLSSILLPGLNKKPPRRMLRHYCQHCDSSFHSRTRMKVICGSCCFKFHDVEEALFLVDESSEW